jgi:ABC-2 type transport system permease protein
MSAIPTESPAPRVVPSLAHAWGGVWRLTFRRFLLPGHWLVLALALGVLALLLLGGVHRGGAGAVIDWTKGVYVTFLVPGLAFMVAAGAMREDMKSGTVDYVLTRPVPRPAFVVFKFLAHTLCTQLDFLLAFGVVLGFAVARDVPGLVSFGFKILFGQVLMVTAFSAFGFLCGVLSSRYVIIGLAYAGIIEVGVGQIPTQISRLSMTQQMRELLGILLDHIESSAASPTLAGTTGIVLVFTVVVLAATAAIFSFREFTGPGET